MSTECKIMKDIRETIAKAKKMYQEYQKEKHLRENPPPPEEIEMTTFRVRYIRIIPERKVSKPIDIPRVVYEQDW